MPNEPGDDEKAATTGEPSRLGASAPITVERREPKARRDDGARRSRAPWLVAAAVLVILLLALVPAVLSGSASGSKLSGFVKTPRDRVGISYGGGPIESVHFQRIVQPGSGLSFNGLFDPLYLYPADQVNYIVSRESDEGSERDEAIVAPTSDRVQVQFQVAVYFKLNIDQLRSFHEELGLRYRAYTEGGWSSLLRDTFRQQIENALQEETRRVEVGELFGDADVLVSMQERIQATLSERLGAALGDRYFCAPTYRPGGECGDPTFVIKKVDIPDDVAKAFEQNRTSQVLIETRNNEVAQREAEARAIAALGISGDAYVRLKAVESGKIDFWVLPSDGNVTIPAPAAGDR